MASLSDTSKMIQNESVFRRYNERVKKSFKELEAVAQEEGHHIDKFEGELHFKCECSDENCSKRIVMKPERYEKIHKDRTRFIVINGHEVQGIEKIIIKENTYSVVEKLVAPPENPLGLSSTNVDNS